MQLLTTHSLWFLPLCLLAGVLIAWYLYRDAPARHGFGRRATWLMATLRALAIGLLAFFLLEPMLRSWVREVRKPVVVIAHDGSASLLAAGDTTALRSTYAEALASLARRLGDDFEVRTFTYGAEVGEGLQFAQEEGATDLGLLFRNIHDRFSGPDLGAVIIDGDGIVNRGRDPRIDAERLGVPVHAIALGDTTVRPDLVLKGVDHNRIGYLGNELPLLARVEARRLAGRRTRISVLKDGRELTGRDMDIPVDRWFTEVPLLVRANEAGLQRFTVRLRTVEGEANEANNSVDIHIDVLDDRRDILILADAPHPDVAAIRQALSGLEGFATSLAYAAEGIPPLEKHDLLVLHQLPSAQHPLRTELQRAADRGIPMLVVLGGRTDMDAFNALGTGVELRGVRRDHTDVQAAVFPTFDRFTMEADQVRAIERFPPLQVPFGQYAVSPAAHMLATQRVGVVRTQYPLIAFHDQSGRRMATIVGEGVWRWRLADHRLHGSTQYFDGLLRRMVQYLALEGGKERFRVEHAPEFAANEPVVFRAELYNASYEPVNDPEVEVVITGEEGAEYRYAFSRAGRGYRLEAGRLPPGSYRYAAHVDTEGGRLTAAGRFSIVAPVLEMAVTVADHALLEDLAVRTGGSLHSPDGMDALEVALRGTKGLVARSYQHATLTDLIDRRWIFLVILLLLAAEWALRRANGAH